MANLSAEFRRTLLHWYQKNGRDLPWRRTRDPYAILVSEIMLQQTQVATVLPYYDRWLKRFPTYAVLARACESDVLHAWQGLGYYTRARNLHAAAKAVRQKFGGTLPRNFDVLRSLPGFGRYTANAVATFAFDQSVPVVDANIARVVSRLFNITAPIDTAAGRDEVWERAEQLVPKRKPGRFNSALMDLGATVCLPRNPQCGICPVKRFCRAPNPLVLPKKRKRPALRRLTEHHAVAVRRDRILLQSCTERWRGMWMLPEARGSLLTRPVHVAKFPFTNHQITLRVFARPPAQKQPNQRWFSLRELDSIPIPSPHRRAINAVLLKSGGAN